MSAKIQKIVTHGTFSLDGGTWDVDNNVWLVGDEREVMVIDPAHSPEAVAKAVNGRSVAAILLTHGHDDHIGAVKETQSILKAADGGEPRIYLNPADSMLWDMVYPKQSPDGSICEKDQFTVAGVTLRAVSTPGHSPGSTCFVIDEFPVKNLPSDAPESRAGSGHSSVSVLFSGDTLFAGGPGATGRSFSDFSEIIESISSKLFTLPESAVVLTGHGKGTTIGTEKPHLKKWIQRGS